MKCGGQNFSARADVCGCCGGVSAVLLLTRWRIWTAQKRHQLTICFALKRRVMEAYLLKKAGTVLWTTAMKGYFALLA